MAEICRIYYHLSSQRMLKPCKYFRVCRLKIRDK